MQVVWDFLVEQVKTNQFFTGAAAGSVTYFILGLLRNTWGKVYYSVNNYFTRNIIISSYRNSRMYNQANLYFAQFIKYPKTISIHNEKDDIDPNSEELDDGTKLKPSLSYGNHWFVYNKYTIIYINVKTEEHHGDEKSDIMTVNIFSLKARSIRKLIYTEFIKTYSISLNTPKVNHLGSRYDTMLPSKPLPKRKLESIFINNDIKTKAVIAIENLSINKHIYEENCLDRHLGILLYGLPGTGKSSFITAIANYFNRSLYYIYPNDKNFPYLGDIKSNGIVVIEDIDCYPIFLSRDDEKADNKLLSKYLKLFDGEFLPDDTIIIITTNHINKLDPAVKRAGRFDLRLEFTPANKELAAQMINKIDPSKIDLLENLEFPCSQAEIQGKVLKLMREVK